MSALEVRRRLYDASESWAEHYLHSDRVDADLPVKMAAISAGLSMYALAASIAIVAQLAGPDIADQLATELDSLLTDGDHAGWNDDLNNPETASEATR